MVLIWCFLQWHLTHWQWTFFPFFFLMQCWKEFQSIKSWVNRNNWLLMGWFQTIMVTRGWTLVISWACSQQKVSQIQLMYYRPSIHNIVCRDATQLQCQKPWAEPEPTWTGPSASTGRDREIEREQRKWLSCNNNSINHGGGRNSNYNNIKGNFIPIGDISIAKTS